MTDKQMPELPFVDGFLAGVSGDDPRCCPHPKMTKEHHEWQRGQWWGVQATIMDAELEEHMNG